jgi:4-hydroxybenzoate polyprenyltransferase
MIAYSYGLKRLVILDVFAIGTGFVLRAAGGAVAIAVPISPWLYVCTMLLALFIGFGKRRSEIVLLEGQAGRHRANLDAYTIGMLDQIIGIVSSATVMAYSLYTFDAASVPENKSMMLTIPFVLYAIFRYLYLVHRHNLGGSPEVLLFTDRPLLLCIVGWGISSIVILALS